ncbi:MAG: AAA family ATPase [Candidatus Melainabacteria bacterium]|nr:AAA family ATPase [Candidatus Melainabacteria bacterium]
MKKYLLSAVLAVVVGAAFVRILSMPSGIISEGPPKQFNNSSKSVVGDPGTPKRFNNTSETVYDNIPVKAKTPEPVNELPVVTDGGDTKITAADPATGKPLEIVIKHEHSRDHGDDLENNLGHDPTTLGSFFQGVLAVVTYIAKLAFGFFVIWFAFLIITGQWRGLLGGGGGRGLLASNRGGAGDAQGIADKVFGQWVNPEDIKGNGFSDVAGVPEAIGQMKKLKLKIVEQAEVVKKIRAEEEAKKAEAKDKGAVVVTAAELMTRLQSMTKKSKFGGKLPQCVLLEGPPGTGKTLLITALAKECNVPVFVISGSDFVEMFVGLGANRVREMFADARDKRPCIIFIDELDAVGRARSNGPVAHPEADQTLNQILVELQGLNTGNQNFGLWIFGATNRVDILDKALLRPGRFTWKIKVDPPHLEGRVAILKVHSGKREVPLAKDVDFYSIASVLGGLTGADLENVVNETALYADELAEAEAEKLRSKGGLSEDEIKVAVKASVSQEDFFEGLLRHLMGVKTEVSLTFEEIFNTVVHEAGHALGIAYEGFLGRTDEIVRFIAVEPRGRSGGLTFKTPSRDAFTKTLDDVDADAVCGFGGSAAQLVFLNTKDSGPDNDFEVVAANIYRAIGRWYGSEKLGPISLGQRGMTNSTEMGAAQKDLIDAECNLKTKVLYARTWWIMNLFIRSESVWTMFWELLEGKIMREDRFAALFAAAMKEIEAHPEWANGRLDALMDKVKKDPYGWSADPLDEGTRAYLTQRIDELRTRYLALCQAAQDS